ncbi:extracellular solute-binding protein [Clostridium sp. 19966]|uniref:extracellular solute-binding protein n=1 Tax=Clostridium sp. 19966 TaxID=2768166 RepID=UPI0028DD41CB|nr:extracellular solute-binding protein [Clostridium sp. 19966]MDT8719075.1 extracellular solute-binding protein [Clostridium sp. 19966]
MKKKLISIALIAFVAIAGSVGISIKNNKKNQDTSYNGESPLKLNVFSMTANYVGKQSGWFAKVIKDKFNIELNIISYNLQGGDSKYAAMMASNDLGDIVIFGAEDQRYREAIKSNLLLDWTQDNMINEYGKDIMNKFPKAIEKSKNNFGNGKSVFGINSSLANMPSNTPSEGNELTYGSVMRWDLYEQIGKPRIKTMEDLLPVLKKMQEINPKSDLGNPTYAFSMWHDWDGNIMMNAKQFACMEGYDELGFLLVKANEDKYQDVLDKNGYYMKTLKLYYDANRMGLVDPDSISQKYDDFSKKMADGQVLFSWFPWTENLYNTEDRVNEGKGFKAVPFDDEIVYSNGFSNLGLSQIISIGAKTKYPERVMEFIDWLYTNEGMMIATNGPKGVTWDMKNNKAELTELGKQVRLSNNKTMPESYGGGTYDDGVNAINFNTLSQYSINPETEEPYDYSLWSSTLNLKPSKLEESWRKDMGTITEKDYFVKNNKVAVNTSSNSSIDDLNDSAQQKQGQVASIIKNYSWKMIFAKSDTEFYSLQNEMISKAKEMGYDELINFYVTQAKKKFAERRNK